MILFLHIETTGLLRDDIAVDHGDQPHLTHLDCELASDAGDALAPRRVTSELIRSGGWKQTPGAEKVHSVTSRRATREGIPETAALWILKCKTDEAKAIVSFQGRFVRDVIGSLLQRETHQNRDGWLAAWHRPGLQFIDLAAACSPFCALRGEDGNTRRPKLAEAYTALTGDHLPVSKLEALRAIYARMMQLNALEAA